MIKLLCLEIKDTCGACPYLKGAPNFYNENFYCGKEDSIGYDKDITEYPIKDDLCIPDWCPLPDKGV